MKPSTRIVGGTAAPKNAWPWQAQLRSASGFPFCGGTLVHPRFVVTASHCIVKKTPSSLRIRLGAHRRADSGESTVQDFRVKRIIKHERYSKPVNLANDIAVIELEQPARLNRAVNLACLPTQSNEIQEGKRCWVTGWGRTSEGGSSPTVLMQVEVPIVSASTCSRAYGRLHESMVCAGRASGGIDSCQGDSGGPMVCEYNGKFNLEGVVSWGKGCARPGKYGVYAKVRHLRAWLDGHIR
ncbi:predicted protein [Nematostella vectensis]|uniref:Peptidase S1 domain-containing protein n=1 Tax=Nematostella vectensis TaxID=45351 RepID=A7SWQ5_NEMVE|nr:predicted protein [Nematostella vectensis]|eukprot:XP_001623958.1 predicted protein [Nematostella vectensis]